MNKHGNLIFIFMLTVALCIGTLIGVVAGNGLFDLAFPKETEPEIQESTSDSQSSDISDQPVDTTPKKMLALTFDDGPNSVNTEKILDLLEQYDAKATFFICGENLDIETRSVFQEAIQLGCEIGNHTFSHKNMTALSEKELLEEIRKTNEKIAFHSGTDYQCKLYRPPYGLIDAEVMNTLYDNGIRMHSIHWSSDSMDWDYQDRYADQLISREDAIEGAFETIVSQTKEGTVILMHDVHSITPDILKLVLEKYTAEGYSFVTVSELFGFEENASKETYFNLYYSPNNISPVTK